MKFKVAVDPSTIWQPRGGEVVFTIEGDRTALDGLAIKSCFAWQRTNGEATFIDGPPVRVLEFGSGKMKLGATIPALPDADTPWLRRILGPAGGAYTALLIVPLA